LEKLIINVVKANKANYSSRYLCREEEL